MIQLILLTGFLGAGKTTFLNRILKDYQDKKIAVIVNEFAETGVDGELVQVDNQGIEMVELTNGSIFCACIKDKFVDALIEVSSREIDYLVVEASGLADPSSISSILSQITPKIAVPYDYVGAICLLDALYFMDYFSLLPALERQIQYSKAVIINKIDLATSEDISTIRDTVISVNPAASIYEVSHCQVSVRDILKTFGAGEVEAQESTNTESSRPHTITIRTTEAISEGQLSQFLATLSPHSYRIKGFCKVQGGTKMVSYVGNVASIDDWAIEIAETELVVISKVGLKIISLTAGSAKQYFTQPLQIRS